MYRIGRRGRYKLVFLFKKPSWRRYFFFIAQDAPVCRQTGPLLPNVCHITALKWQTFSLFCACQDPSAMPRPTSQDLAGFWDLLQLSIEDVSLKFDELHQMKLNEWKIIESPERKVSRMRAGQVIFSWHWQLPCVTSCWFCKPAIISFLSTLLDNTLQK